jgi:predicted nucleic acid-binding protein
MAVVVADTTPLHYLVLTESVFVLEKLYGEVIIPAAVVDELIHPSAPAKLLSWAANMPGWIRVEPPKFVPDRFVNLDRGEREESLHPDVQMPIEFIWG